MSSVEDMEFGVFTLTDTTADATAATRVEDVIRYGVHADELGLDVFGLGEHHTPRFAVSSPAVVLAAIGSRTHRITLTSAVSVLSVLDPVRLYQDFAQLDLVSGGRAEITAGRSAYAEPFELFGVPLAEYEDVFDEKLGLLLALRQGGPVSWSGRFRSPLDTATIVPVLDRQLPVRLGVGGSPGSVHRAGRLGLPMTLALLGGSPRQASPLVDLYHSAGAAARATDTLSVAVASHLYVGPTASGARDEFYPHYRAYFDAGLGRNLDRRTYEQMASPEGPLIVGSPAEVAAKILHLQEVLGIDRFLGQVDIGGLPKTAVLASMRRLAEEVAPLVRNSLSSAPHERPGRIRTP